MMVHTTRSLIANSIGSQPAGVLSMQTVAMPADTNWSGDVFGGWLVSQMDLAGAVYARLHSKGRVATVSIENVVFHSPVKVGSILACYTKMLRVGNTSMRMLIEVWEIHDEQQDVLKVTDGIFTFVGLDLAGNKRTVPPFTEE
jgi:acyl-CoA thioesterase YciA